MKKWTALLLALLLLGGCALASAPSTPAPMPEPGMGGRARPVPNPAQITVITAEGETALPTYHSHSSNGNAHFDGLYAPWFGGVSAALAEGNVPEITGAVQEIQAVFSGEHRSTSASTRLYREGETGLESVDFEGDEIPWAEVPPGRYLLQVSYSASGEGYSYSGFALAWVLLP